MTTPKYAPATPKTDLLDLLGTIEEQLYSWSENGTNDSEEAEMRWSVVKNVETDGTVSTTIEITSVIAPNDKTLDDVTRSLPKPGRRRYSSRYLGD